MISYLNSRRSSRGFTLQADTLGHMAESGPAPGVEGQAYDTYPTDKGCRINPSCLSCLRERCIYDEDPAAQREHDLRQRHQYRTELVLQLGRQGMSRHQAVKEACRLLGLEQRAVFRSLERMGFPRDGKGGRPRKAAHNGS